MQSVAAQQEPNVVVDLVSESGERWLLQYFLQEYQSSDGSALYGVRVDKLVPEGRLLESNETFAITDSRDKAAAIVEFLSKGTVPPCVLLDMVDEWFSGEVWSE